MAGYFKEAIESATILVNSTRKSNDLIGEGYGLMILGAAEIKLKNYENAMDYFDKNCKNSEKMVPRY